MNRYHTYFFGWDESIIYSLNQYFSKGCRSIIRSNTLDHLVAEVLSLVTPLPGLLLCFVMFCCPA